MRILVSTKTQKLNKLNTSPEATNYACNPLFINPSCLVVWCEVLWVIVRYCAQYSTLHIVHIVHPGCSAVLYVHHSNVRTLRSYSWCVFGVRMRTRRYTGYTTKVGVRKVELATPQNVYDGSGTHNKSKASLGTCFGVF